MDGAERDSTQDWLLPEGSSPPLLAELELRIDEAMAVAKASAQGVEEVGDVALGAARQARRAAELAEAASIRALEASRAAAAVPRQTARQEEAPVEVGSGAAAEPRPEGDAGLRRFRERADRVAARLRALERRPSWSASSAGVARRRSDG